MLGGGGGVGGGAWGGGGGGVQWGCFLGFACISCLSDLYQCDPSTHVKSIWMQGELRQTHLMQMRWGVNLTRWQDLLPDCMV